MASAAKTRRLKRMKTEIGMGAVRPPDDGVSIEEADRLADEYRPSWETDEPDDESGVSAVAAPEPLDATPTGPATPIVIAAPPAAAVVIREGPPPRLMSAKATLPLGVIAPTDAELQAALASADAPAPPTAATAAAPPNAAAPFVPAAAAVASPAPAAAKPQASRAPAMAPHSPAIHMAPERDDLEDTGRLRALAARRGGSGMRGSVIIAGSAIIALGIVISTYLITRRPDGPAETTPETAAAATQTGTVGTDPTGTAAATPTTTPEPSGAAVPAPAPAEPPAAPAVDPAATAAATGTPTGSVPTAPAVEAPATPTPVVPDPPMTRVRLSTVPAGATLTIDGVTVINPYEARVARDGRAHEIGATLEGHDAATRSLTFDRDELTLRLTLRRTPPPPEPVAVAPSFRQPSVTQTASAERPDRPARPARPATPRRPTKRGAGFVTTNPY